MQRFLEAIIGGIKRFFAFWSFLLIEGEYWPLEAMRAVLLVTTSLVVLNPAISTYGTSATYKYIEWLPESAFGAGLLFVALNSILALVLWNYRYRMLTTFGMFFTWSLLFIFFFSANPNGILIPWMGIFGFTSFVNWLRVIEDSKFPISPPWKS